MPPSRSRKSTPGAEIMIAPSNGWNGHTNTTTRVSRCGMATPCFVGCTATNDGQSCWQKWDCVHELSGRRRRGSQLTARLQFGSRCWVSVESDNGVSGCVQLGLCSNVKHRTRLSAGRPPVNPLVVGSTRSRGVTTDLSLLSSEKYVFASPRQPCLSIDQCRAAGSRARGAAAGWARQIIKRTQAMAAQLVTLHGEAIFALARRLYLRGWLDSRAVRDISVRLLRQANIAPDSMQGEHADKER